MRPSSTLFPLLLVCAAAAPVTAQGQDPTQLIKDLREPSQREQAADALIAVGPPAVPDLLRALEGERDTGALCAQVRILGRIGPSSRPAVPTMVRLLAHGDRGVRYTTFQALENLGEAALSELIRGLAPRRGKPDEVEVRSRCAHLIKKLGAKGKPAVPTLISLLDDPVVDARSALRGIGGVAVPELIEALPSRHRQVEPLLRSMAAQNVPAVVAALEHEHRRVRRWAAWRVGRLKPPPPAAVPGLLAQLASDRPCDESSVRKSLVKIGRPAVPALKEATDSSSGRARRVAVQVLVKIKGAEGAARAAGLRLLDDADRRVRKEAAQALADLGATADDLPRLLEALDERDRDTAGSIARAVGSLGPAAEAAVPRLLEVVVQSAGARDDAAAAIKAIGAAGVEHLTKALQGDERRRASALWVLRRFGPEAQAALPAVIEAARNGSSIHRRLAVEALGSLDPTGKSTLPVLVELLAGRDRELRALAARSLGRIGEPAVAPLIDALRTREPSRFETVKALAEVGPPALPALKALIAEPAPPGGPARARGVLTAREAAIQALGWAGPEAVPLLVELTRDPDPVYRRAAVRCLGVHKAGAEALARCLRDEHSMVNVAAAKALGQLGPKGKPAAAALLHASRKGDLELRAMALRALPRVGADSGAALDVMLKALDEPELFRAASRALDELQVEPRILGPKLTVLLKKNGDDALWQWGLSKLRSLGPAARPAVPLLTGALRDPDRGVRLGAILTLGAIGPGAESAVPALAERLGEPEADVHAIVKALTRIGPAAGKATPALIGLWRKQPDVAGIDEALAAIGEPAARLLAPLLKDSEWHMPVARTAFLMKEGAAGALVPDLIRVLRSAQDESLVNTLTGALERAAPGDPAQANVWIPLLEDPRPRVRGIVPLAFQRLGKRGARQIPALRNAAREGSREGRRLAILCLGHAGADGSKAAQDLSRLLAGKDPQVRRACLATVERLGPAAVGSVPALVSGLRSKRLPIYVTEGALAAVGPAAIPSLLDNVDAAVQESVQRAIAQMGPVAVPELVAGLQRERALERETAARTLGWMHEKPKQALPALARGLRDPDLAVRQACVDAVLAIQPTQAEEGELIELLRDPRIKWRGGIAAALMKIGCTRPEFYSTLVDLLGVQEDNLCGSISSMLGRSGARAIPVLTLALDSTDEVTRIGALSALRQIGAPARATLPKLAKLMVNPRTRGTDTALAMASVGGVEALPVFLEGLQSPALEVRAQSAYGLSALQRQAAPAVPKLIALLKAEEKMVAKYAYTEALGRIGPAAAEAVPVLVAQLDDPRFELRFGTLLALRGIGKGAQSALPRIRSFLTHPDERLRSVAKGAVEAISP